MSGHHSSLSVGHTVAPRESLAVALARKARNGEPGSGESRLLGAGNGFRVFDILCTRGPRDAAFDERHDFCSVSLVTAGVFNLRRSRCTQLMSPGSILLINAHESFECSHQHSEGDRCLSFQFTPQLIEELARDMGVKGTLFRSLRLEPSRELAPLLARAQAASEFPEELEDVALELASHALSGATRVPAQSATKQDERRVAHAVRRMHACLSARHDLASLARSVDLSRYHFLRVFKRVTGLTPHHWLLRARLLEAARLLRDGNHSVTDIALAVGFEDLSNFSRTFRAEFRASPRTYQERCGR